jgi:hypothetical protein
MDRFWLDKVDYCKGAVRKAIRGRNEQLFDEVGYVKGEAYCNGEVRMTARVW